MSETDFDVKVEIIEDDFDQIERIENEDQDMTRVGTAKRFRYFR